MYIADGSCVHGPACLRINIEEIYMQVIINEAQEIFRLRMIRAELGWAKELDATTIISGNEGRDKVMRGNNCSGFLSTLCNFLYMF